MKEKFVKILEQIDEGFAGAMAKGIEADKKKRQEVQTKCNCSGGRSLKASKHLPNCPARKLLGEDVEELDEGRGRPKKAVDPDAPAKEKGKRGRPKADDDDRDTGEEGKRDLKLTAHIKAGKKETTDSKTIENASVDSIKKYVQDFENQLTVKYANKWDVDEDEINVHIKDNHGWTGAKAEDQGGNVTASGSMEDE